MQRDPLEVDLLPEFQALPRSLQEGLLRLGRLAGGRALCHLVCRFEDSELASVHESKLKLKYRRGTVVE